MDGLQILQSWYERVWVDADLDAVAEFFDVEALASGLLPDLAADMEDFQALVPAVLRLIRDVSFEINDSMQVDDRAWALTTISAKRASDLTPVKITGQIMIKIRDGKIIEAQNHFDFIGFLEQIGALPSNTLELCLAGETLN